MQLKLNYDLSWGEFGYKPKISWHFVRRDRDDLSLFLRTSVTVPGNVSD